MKNLLLSAGLLLILQRATGCPPCHTPTHVQEVDWERVNEAGRLWYDTVVVPEPNTQVDCWNWERIDVTEDGIMILSHRWVKGGDEETAKVDVHFHRVEGKPGIYILKPEHKQRFVNSTAKATAHKAEEEDLEELQETANRLYSAEFFFDTDYENYLIIASCMGEAGWKAFARTRNHDPTADDIIRIQGVLRKYGINRKMTLMDACIEKSHRDNSCGK